MEYQALHVSSSVLKYLGCIILGNKCVRLFFKNEGIENALWELLFPIEP